MARLKGKKNKSRPEDQAAFCQGVGGGVRNRTRVRNPSQIVTPWP